MAARRSRCHNGRTNQYEVTSSDQTPWLAREASGRPGYQSSDPGHSWVQVMGVNRATPIGGHFTLGVRWPHHYHSRLTRHGLWEARMGSGPFCPFPPSRLVISAQAPPIAHHWEAVRQRGLAGRQIRGAAGGPREAPSRLDAGRSNGGWGQDGIVHILSLARPGP